jgi:TetR/AcrR family transcriptional repressor of nem operon
MARPKAFDRNAALQGAIAVFCDHGYDGTSTEMLLAAMGISRQSMYDTFGDKRRLYLEALQQYAVGHVSQHIRALHGGASPRAGLAAMLDGMATHFGAQGQPGCMGIGAVCEFGRGDAEVSLLTDTAGRMLQSAIEGRIGEAQAAGEIDDALAPRAAAQFLMATLSGLKISGRGGASVEDLRDIARMAMRGLR